MEKTIVIAGASGYLGRWFIHFFKHKYRIIALTRRKVDHNPDPEVEWRQVELYSITSTTEALAGADFAIYLIHSMSSSTKLNQGSFEDTDLLLADNFSRAAEMNGIRQILYMGGILPKEVKEEEMSRHLKSRLEVEKTLRSRGALIALRAGIIVGPGGSSFDMIRNLVRKLPIMVCPKWTESLTQPISLKDTMTIMDFCLGNEKVYGKIFEIGSPEVLSYKEMLIQTAEVMGKKRLVFSVPLFTVELSKLWVGYFGESPTKLVSPLVESLKHKLTVSKELEFRELEIDYLTYKESVAEALDTNAKISKTPSFEKEVRRINTVRSIQRFTNTRHRSALWVANRYKVWLPTFFSFLINAKENKTGDIGFYILNSKKPMLQLTWIPDRSDSKRQLFYISGGYLVKRFDYGWLEFREVLDGKYMLTAIHEFVPRLPWVLYLNTQARMHLWVMNRFKRYLKKFKDDK